MRLVLIVSLLFPGLLRAGWVVTRDGLSYAGEVALDGGRVSIRTAQGVRQFALDQVKEAVLAPVAVSETDVPVAPKDEQAAQRNVLVEFFAGSEFKQRVFARYEPHLAIYLSDKEVPDPAVTMPYCVRFTTRLTVKKGGGYTLGLEARSGVRMWVNDELKIDRWKQKAHVADRVPVRVDPDKPVSLRLEVMAGEYETYVRTALHGGGTSVPQILAENFLRPEKTNQPPEAKLVWPAEETWLVSPRSVTLKATASDPDGKVAAVEFTSKGTVIGRATSAPYAFVWKDPPMGHYAIQAKAIDDKGLSEYSRAISLDVGGQGENGSLPPPWGEQTIYEKAKTARPGSATYLGGAFRIKHGGGLLVEGHDDAHFVYQAVKGDFTLTARVRSVSPADQMAGAMAGLMVRGGMHYRARAVALLTGPEHTYFIKRTDYWGKPGGTDGNATAPCWLRLIRHGNRFRGYSSADGKTWVSMGSERLELGPEVGVGLCAMSRLDDKPCEAVIEQVSLKEGTPAMAFTTAGLLLRDGSFIACRAGGVRDNVLYYDRNGKERLPMRLEKIARIVYQPMLAELAEKLPAGQTGVLLASGDFVEGEVKEISYRVLLSTVLFGNRYFTVKGDNSVTALCLREVEAPRGYTIVASDGSVYRSEATPRAEGGVLKMEGSMLGAVELPMKEVVKVRVD